MKRPHEVEDVQLPYAGDCIEHEGSRDIRGYGRIFANGKHRKAHRVAYEQHVGAIGAGKIICHTCDNPACVNPQHLWQGTDSDNVRDMLDKKRGHIQRWQGVPLSDAVALLITKTEDEYLAGRFAFLESNGLVERICTRFRWKQPASSNQASW
jgi:hypothetical protein